MIFKIFKNTLNRVNVKISVYIYILPALILVTSIAIYPILNAIQLSVSKTTFTEIQGFVGLENYIKIFGTSEGRLYIRNSIIYTFSSLVIIMPWSLLLASLLNKPIRFRRFFRTLIVMPWVVSQTIAGLTWLWIVNPNYGPLMDLVARIGLPRIDLLSYSFTSMAALVCVNIWLQNPYAVVLNLAGLQSIPKELYEAASIDGASAWVSFKNITLPLIKPTLMIAAILTTLLCFNMVTLILTFTSGGPFSATEVLSLRAFKEAFVFWRIGAGSAYAVIIFCFNIFFSLWYIKLLGRKY